MRWNDNPLETLSVSNLLLIACAAATMLSWIFPSLLAYGLAPYDLLVGDYPRVAIEIVAFQFLHGGILHILSNGIFLAYFGNGVERMMGRARYVGFFVGSTLVVAASILAFSDGVTVGISGFTMAILSYLALELRAQRHPEANAAFGMLAVNIFIGLSPGISLTGHAAGAVAGAIAFFAPRLFRKFRR